MDSYYKLHRIGCGSPGSVRYPTVEDCVAEAQALSLQFNEDYVIYKVVGEVNKLPLPLPKPEYDSYE